VNEAIADYFSASFFKDPRIGFALAQLCSPTLFTALGMKPDGLRNLSDPLTMLDDLSDVLDGSGIPEEHAAGHIFGCALWRIRAALKQTKADRAILFSVLDWPQTMAEVGFGTVDNTNAVAAYATYYTACIQVLVDHTAGEFGTPSGLKLLGAAMINGVIGCPELNTEFVGDATGGGGGSIDTAFLGTSAGHFVGVTLNAGQTFSLTVIGNLKDQTFTDIAFLGPPGGLTFVLPKKVSINGLIVSAPKMLVNTSGTYTIEVLNTGATNGRFRINLKIAP
jgi:hypothetical protein